MRVKRVSHTRHVIAQKVHDANPEPRLLRQQTVANFSC